MGSCVSLHKGSDSAMKLDLSMEEESKDEKLMIPSPVKDKVNVGDRTIADVALKSHWSPPRFLDAGSKDEAFFDSQPWLESDCEDDFFSVNGDFTPSRGSTPVHHSFSLGNLRAIKPPVAQETQETLSSTSEPSPPQDKKKRLSELFKESLRSDPDVDDENAGGNKNSLPVKMNGLSLQEKSGNRSPYLARALSGVSSDKTPNGLFKSEEKSGKYAQCCLPRLRSSRSFNDRKSRMSPAHSVG